MRSLYRPQWGSTSEEKIFLKSQAIDAVRVRGTGVIPDPPRNLQAQAGNSKVMLTWTRPKSKVSGYRVYRDTENNLVLAVQDSGATLAEIPSSAGASPTVTSFFVSAVNAFGNESTKAQVVSSAKTFATAPSDPLPPPDTPPPSGGGGTGDDGSSHRGGGFQGL